MISSSTPRSAPSAPSSAPRSASSWWTPTLGLHNQDLRIATEAWEHGCGLIIVVNKWDLVEEKDANTARRGQEALIEKAPFLRYVPFLYVSALTGQRVRKLLDLILEVAEDRERTGPDRRGQPGARARCCERTAPPQKPGEEVKLLYASQIGTAPPTFAIVTNRPDDVPESYQRYLVHGFRDVWPFTGSPLRLQFTAADRGGDDAAVAVAARVVPARRHPDQLPGGPALPGHRSA